MSTNNFTKLIEVGEIAREKEQYEKALNSFNQIIVQAGLAKKYEYVFNAIIHRSHLYKHLYQRSTDEVFLILMKNDCDSAYEIAKSKTKDKLDIAFMELGNYYFLKKNYKLSSNYYSQAIKKLKNKTNVTYAEFLSHYAISQALLGKKQGLMDLKKAAKIIAADRSLRPFHKLVVESGNNMRMIQAIHHLKVHEDMTNLLVRAKSQAETLAKKYKMPMRQIQFKKLLQKLD